MTRRPLLALAPLLAVLSGVLAACSARTDVSLTGNTPARYSHVWITTQAVWLNTSATAGPDDAGWAKFPLSTPATVDLVAENGGTLGSLVTGLKVAPATYSQVRLIPVDPSAPLAASAQAAGAQFNAEADYVDSSGTTHQLALELLSPEKGIGIQTSLRVPVGNVGSALAGTRALGASNANSSVDQSFVTASANTGSVTSSTTTSPTTGLTTTTPTTTSTTTATFGTTAGTTAGTTSASTSAASSAPPNQFAVSLDGVRDLVQFTYATTPVTSAVMLSAHAAAYDLTRVGAIQGTLTLTSLTGIAGSSGAPAITVNAEVLSTDGTRRVVVSSTPVHSDGTFMLYPLAAGSDSAHPIDYDVVIHGAGIATIIIKGVQVAKSASNTSTTTPTASTQSGTGTTGTNTTSTPTTSSTTITPVSVGTLLPRAATSFTADLAAGGSRLPAGAAVAFYQTLATKGEVPYVIESAPIDPFNEVLANPQPLSKQTVDSGTWSSSATSVTLVSAAPTDGAGTYTVAASAPSFADGPLTTRVAAPGSGTTAMPFTLPALTLAAGVSSGTISATVTQATARKYTEGELLITHDGTLVASAPLNAALAGAGAVTVTGVPAGVSAAVYYVSVRAWNSSNPSGTLKRQAYPAAIDLRSTGSGSLQLTIN